MTFCRISLALTLQERAWGIGYAWHIFLDGSEHGSLARNKSHRQCVIDAPVPQVQCIRQRRTRRYAPSIPCEKAWPDWLSGRLRCRARTRGASIARRPARETNRSSPGCAHLCRHCGARWMRLKVFHGTYPTTCANSVLPTFMRHPSRLNPKASQICNPKFKSWTPMNPSKPALLLVWKHFYILNKPDTTVPSLSIISAALTA